ncbi:MAG: LysE family transporter [Pseudomonadota bacterium]
MDYLALILAVLLVDLLALISPGPNFILVTSAAVSQTRGHALSTACGIAMGSLIWASASALGIASVLEVFPVLGLILKGVGVIYLIYLGIRLLRSQGVEPKAAQKTSQSLTTGFWRGMLVNLTNPKSAAYYASVFAAFLTPDMPLWVLAVLIGAIAAMSLAWHGILAVGFSTGPVRARYIAASKYIDRACGGILICLGLRLAWDAR